MNEPNAYCATEIIMPNLWAALHWGAWRFRKRSARVCVTYHDGSSTTAPCAWQPEDPEAMLTILRAVHGERGALP
jgi:hypothetical protein